MSINTLLSSIYNIGNLKQTVFGLSFHGDPGCPPAISGLRNICCENCHNQTGWLSTSGTIGNCNIDENPWCSGDGKWCFSQAIGSYVPTLLVAHMTGTQRVPTFPGFEDLARYYDNDFNGDVYLKLSHDGWVIDNPDIPDRKFYEVTWAGNNCGLVGFYALAERPAGLCVQGNTDNCNTQQEQTVWIEFVGINKFPELFGTGPATYGYTAAAYRYPRFLSGELHSQGSWGSFEPCDKFKPHRYMCWDQYPCTPDVTCSPGLISNYVSSIGLAGIHISQPIALNNSMEGVHVSVEPYFGRDFYVDCCDHGTYCPTYAITYGSATGWTGDNLSSGEKTAVLDGACCAWVNISNIQQPDGGIATCYFGYVPAVVPSSTSAIMKHIGQCGWFASKHKSCTHPYPDIVGISHNGSWYHTITSWGVNIGGTEDIISPIWPNPQRVSFSLSDTKGQVDEWDQSMRLTPSIVNAMIATGVNGPNPFGSNYSNATGTIKFGGTWDTCKDDAGSGYSTEILDIWGWTLKYQDNRGIDNRVLFISDGAGMSWRSPLHNWTLESDIGTRPYAIQLSIEGSCTKLGRNHGFCFDGNWLNSSGVVNKHAEDSAAKCKVVEIIQEDSSRWQYGSCDFMPGSQLVLTPIFDRPDPDIRFDGSLCEVNYWAFYWNWDHLGAVKETILSHDTYIDEENVERDKWISSDKTNKYTIRRLKDNKDGAANYRLNISLAYNNYAYLHPLYIETDPIDSGDGYFVENWLKYYMALSIDGNYFWEFYPGTTFVYVASPLNEEYDIVKQYTVWATKVVEIDGGIKTVIYTTEAIPSNLKTPGIIYKIIDSTFSTNRAINCCYNGIIPPSTTLASASKSYSIIDVTDDTFVVIGDCSDVLHGPTDGQESSIISVYGSTFWDGNYDVYGQKTYINYDGEYTVSSVVTSEKSILDPDQPDQTNPATITITTITVEMGKNQYGQDISIPNYTYGAADRTLDSADKRGFVKLYTGNITASIFEVPEGINVPFSENEYSALSPGGSFIPERGTGCVSECDAQSWNIVVSGLPIDYSRCEVDGYVMSDEAKARASIRTGSLRYMPASKSWWHVTKKPPLIMTVTRLYDESNEYKLGGSNKLGRYAAYVTYDAKLCYKEDEEGPDIRREYVVFNLDGETGENGNPGLNCTSIGAGNAIVVNDNEVTWWITTRKYAILNADGRSITMDGEAALTGQYVMHGTDIGGYTETLYDRLIPKGSIPPNTGTFAMFFESGNNLTALRVLHPTDIGEHTAVSYNLVPSYSIPPNTGLLIMSGGTNLTATFK